MMDSNILDLFFDEVLEKEINENMFYRDYCYPYDLVFEYIKGLIEIPLDHFVEYARANCIVNFIEHGDVIQYSSLEAATIGLTNKLKLTTDEGFSFVEVGQLLLNDQCQRNELAYRKYGENHAKTARQFGLVQLLYNKTYLSALGFAYPNIDDDAKRKLLRRLILRNKYFKLIVIKSEKETVRLDGYLDFLAETTKKRRMSNIKMCWNLILEEIPKEHNLRINVTY